MKQTIDYENLISSSEETIKKLLEYQLVNVVLWNGTSFSNKVRSIGYREDAPNLCEGIIFEDGMFMKFNSIKRIEIV